MYQLNNKYAAKCDLIHFFLIVQRLSHVASCYTENSPKDAVNQEILFSESALLATGKIKWPRLVYAQSVKYCC